MFMTEDTKTSWNTFKVGYELTEKLSFEDKAIKKFVPVLKEIGVHPYRWVRLTVPEGFIYKSYYMPMAPGLKQLLDIDFAEKSYVTYDYLAWKLRCFNNDIISGDVKAKMLPYSKTAQEAEEAINELFLMMIDSETAKYPISKWKRYLIERLIKNLNRPDGRTVRAIVGCRHGGALKLRDGDNDRMA